MRRTLGGIWSRYWQWYENNYRLNVTVAALLFVLQLVHLYWLSTDVVIARLFGANYWPEGELVRTVIIYVDFTEIPALVSVSMVYINELRKQFNLKDLAYLFALDIQVLHIFWITDEFVVETFAAGAGLLPVWLAWVAIFIDYLELPVVVGTVRKAVDATRGGEFEEFLETDFGD